MPASEVIWTGVVQGIGAGAIIVPLGVVTFATLDPVHRTEAASIWNLVRSAGSSIGIAVAIFIVARMASVSRADLVNFVSPFNLVFQNPNLAGWASLEHTGNLARFSDVKYRPDPLSLKNLAVLGRLISTYAGKCGQPGYDGDAGEATSALLDRPYGLTLDADGNLYVADTHNHRVRIIYK